MTNFSRSHFVDTYSVKSNQYKLSKLSRTNHFLNVGILCVGERSELGGTLVSDSVELGTPAEAPPPGLKKGRIGFLRVGILAAPGDPKLSWDIVFLVQNFWN